MNTENTEPVTARQDRNYLDLRQPRNTAPAMDPVILIDPAVIALATRAAKIAGAKGADARRFALQAAANHAEDRLAECGDGQPRTAATWR